MKPARVRRHLAGGVHTARDRHLTSSTPFTDERKRRPSSPLLVIADERVLKLHPRLARDARNSGAVLLPLRAGESAKSLRALERLTTAALSMPRALTLIALGGGTIGDLATVFAHTFKRGVGRFIQFPTTLLAAVDSSLGGKGAVNVGSAKNVLGVFHEADEVWLDHRLFSTLTETQRREGRIEALKMVVTLDARRWKSWSAGLPDDGEVVLVARALKRQVVAVDPYETKGLRTVLNFGHTFGHVIESLSGFRVRHGEAVGLGMLVALDEGVRRGITPPSLAAEVEARLPVSRARLHRWQRSEFAARTRALLAADKKRGWVLLRAPGKVTLAPW